MSSDFWERMSNIAANADSSKLASPTATPPYSFTEAISVIWHNPVDLDDKSTVEGQLWARTISTYASHQATSRVWWGLEVDTARAAKLIIDWKSEGARNAFHASQEMSILLGAWNACANPINTGESDFFVFAAMQGYRQNAFQPADNYLNEAVTVFVTFHLADSWSPDEIDPGDQLSRTRKAVWDNAWSIFRKAALNSEGAWILDKSLDGWSVGATPAAEATPVSDQKSFVGVFRFQNADTENRFVRWVRDLEQRYLGEGLPKLKALAEHGMIVEAVRMQYESPLDDRS